MAAFVWGDGGAQMTPEAIAAQRKVAQAMMARGGDYSPVQSPWQGVARVAEGLMGGLDARHADAAEKRNAVADRELLASLIVGGSSAPGAASPAVVAPAPSPAAPGKIYSNDEPSPLDPPSGQDRRNMIATILGEAGNEPQLGKNAVASVIRTRAVDGGYGGNTPSAVVQAPNQFEPWNTDAGRQRMTAAAANPQMAASADAAIRSAYGEGGKAPVDPTEGMTHFYSPSGQTAMGRSAPPWAGGESVTIGGHVFNSPDDAKIPANAQLVQGALPSAPVAKVADAMSGVNPAVLATMASPYASEGTKKIAAVMLASQMKSQGLINAGAGKVYDPATKTWLTPPKDPDADIPDNFEKGPDGKLRPVAGGPADLEYIARAAAAKHPPSAPMDDATADFLAERVRAGDTKALIGLGRGTQGAENLAKIQGLVAAKATAGNPVSEAAQNILRLAAEQQGNVSASRALGTTQTKFGVAEKAAQESFPIAQAASDLVPRTQWKGLTQLIQAGQTQANDPNLKKFLIATDTAVKDYARTINPTGVLRESDIEYARKILSTADSPEAYRAALDQLNTEVGVMHRAIERQKDELRGLPDKGVGHGAPAAAAVTTGPKEGDTAHNPTTGEVIIRKGGKWVPVS